MEKALVVLGIMLGAAVMIAARRWKNNDVFAGRGIAGWTIFALIIYLIASTSK